MIPALISGPANFLKKKLDLNGTKIRQMFVSIYRE